jgi:hypothetical protein
MASGGITISFVNEWLERHRGHKIEIRRRRHADHWTDEQGDPLPSAAAVPQMIITSLMCVDCHVGVAIHDESDSGQPLERLR